MGDLASRQILELHLELIYYVSRYLSTLFLHLASMDLYRPIIIW